MTFSFDKAVGIAVAVCSFQFIQPMPAYAADVAVTQESVANRLNIAGSQRMLTQRMAKSFCYASIGVDTNQNIEILRGAQDLYQRSHMGFREGDENLNLFVERNQLIINQWKEIDSNWRQLARVYNTKLNQGNVADADTGTVVDMTTELLKMNNDMATQMTTYYSKKIGQAGVGGAILIDLYGRQRMLSQKMSKELCLVAKGYDVEGSRTQLQDTLGIFDASLNAFINGLPEAGIPPAPSAEIKAQLELAKGHWDKVSAIANTVAQGGSVDQNALVAFSQTMDVFLVEMNKAVSMLSEQTAKS
ncbi:type IV pili methyl-accepting chemotaxis transducer N-terminal domain-containing protein [Pseudaestuariivita rosea]|uniref:type IV pili methyl-accepting chemotaxis transducer N-terminal domain-containing protein n=1 Tax=Pseudaestuariivita rosea TaxID=2763263 RepID=UPI001ABA4981|nr:type IV pili methyl-accepting chemotaxis transducer N-terminal domain-containing protein [Pseudaestuariivita rosea]